MKWEKHARFILSVVSKHNQNEHFGFKSVKPQLGDGVWSHVQPCKQSGILQV